MFLYVMSLQAYNLAGGFPPRLIHAKAKVSPAVITSPPLYPSIDGAPGGSEINQIHL